MGKFEQTPARRLAVALCAVLFVFGALPAEGAAPAPEMPSYWPKWLKEAMRRESRRLPHATIRLGDGEVETQVRGELLGSVEPTEFGWYFVVNFGPISPMECWVFNEPQYLATTLINSRQVRSDQIQAEHGGVAYKHNTLYFNEAGALKGAPYLATERMYILETEPQTTLGLLKVRAAEKDGVTFVCSHEELGYRKTFAKAFQDLITRAEVSYPAPDYYYREVVEHLQGEIPVGITTRQFFIDEEGDTVIQTATSILAQVGENALATSDTTQLEFSANDGGLINAYQTHIENGALIFDLSLRAGEDGVWAVEGEHIGEEVKKPLEADATPVSTLGQARTIANVLGSKDSAQADMQVWLPATEPLALVPGEFAVTKRRRGKSTGTLTIGPRAMEATVDNDGTVIEASYTSAGRNVTLRRVFDDGSLAGGRR